MARAIVFSSGIPVSSARRHQRWNAISACQESCAVRYMLLNVFLNMYASKSSLKWSRIFFINFWCLLMFSLCHLRRLVFYILTCNDQILAFTLFPEKKWKRGRGLKEADAGNTLVKVFLSAQDVDLNASSHQLPHSHNSLLVFFVEQFHLLVKVGFEKAVLDDTVFFKLVFGVLFGDFSSNFTRIF